MNKRLQNLAVIGLVSLVFSACAHKGAVTDQADGGGLQSDEPVVKLREVESFRVTDPEGPKVDAAELDQIPTEINPLVEKWVEYFQGRGRPHMERYLARSTRYSKLMKKILRQNGLPEDLIYIALIESGFSPKATSRAAAVGYWQFIRGTGKRYGLEINALVDERRDPVMATQAAAEYFKGLYSVFGSWYLAMASYNVGENRVKKEVMNHTTRDFWELARKRRFPKETINYIPKFIAAKLIGNDPAKYGFTDVEYLTPIEFEHVQVAKPVNLKIMAQTMGMDYDDLKQLNPKFKGEIAPLDGKSLELRIPVGQQQVALAAAEKSFVGKVEYVADAGETEIHKIKSGESLYTIAHRYKTTVAWLRDVNDLKPGRKLRIGQRLAVPDRTGVKAVKVVAKIEKKEDAETAASSPELVTKKGVFYIVQAGDTLSAIADEYDSSIEELRRMNKMSRATILRAGMKLKVPKDDGLPTDPSVAKGTKTEEKELAPETSTDVAAVSAVPRDPQAVSVTDAHVVKRGENLTTIAHKYGVTIKSIREANNFTKRTVLKIGSRIKIPTSNKETRRDSSSAGKRKAMKFHVVRRGENLSTIAEKYQISMIKLKKHNDLGRGSKLLVGTRLLIPVAFAR